MAVASAESNAVIMNTWNTHESFLCTHADELEQRIKLSERRRERIGWTEDAQTGKNVLNFLNILETLGKLLGSLTL